MRILLVTHYFPPETGAPQARLVGRDPGGIVRTGPSYLASFNGHGLYRLRGTIRYTKAA